jgi:calnexin
VSQVDNVTGQWALKEVSVPQGIPHSKMLFMTKAEAYYGLSTQFSEPLNLHGRTLVVQYEVRFQDPLHCGGAYMKLFHKDNFSPEGLTNETRYIIMFGPDKCGGQMDKVHFIFRHKNPISGLYEEKHMTEAPPIKSDKLTHLYTLIVRPDNSFEVLIDGESVKKGDLLKDFLPPVIPPKEINDPADVKPANWVEIAEIDDPEAKKPDDWDEDAPEFIKDPERLQPPEGWLLNEPKTIPDPDAQQPEAWDDIIHGEWEAASVPNPKCEEAPGCGEYEVPLIKNPAHKGKWKAPKIANPAYKGPWKARQIPNPYFHEDLHPHNFEPIIGVGFELWMVEKNVGYGNVYIGTDEAAVHEWNKAHFIPKSKIQQEEQKKLESTPAPTVTPKPGFAGTVTKVVGNMKRRLAQLCAESPVAMIALLVVVVVVAVILALLCGGRNEPPVATPTLAPKDETVIAAKPRDTEGSEKRAPAHKTEE